MHYTHFMWYVRMATVSFRWNSSALRRNQSRMGKFCAFMTFFTHSKIWKTQKCMSLNFAFSGFVVKIIIYCLIGIKFSDIFDAFIKTWNAILVFISLTRSQKYRYKLHLILYSTQNKEYFIWLHLLFQVSLTFFFHIIMLNDILK